MPFRRHLSFANVTALLALFVALGGTGYAAIKLPANSVGNAQIQRDAVSSSKIRQNAVGASEIRTGAVGGNEIRGDAVGSSEIRTDAVGTSEVRRGAVGSSELRDRGVGAVDIATGAVGSAQLQDGGVAPADLSTDTRAAFQAATLREAVNEDGDAVAGNAKSVKRNGPGDYTVSFDRDVSGCFYSATLAPVKNGSSVDTPDLAATISLGSPKATTDVVVRTRDNGISGANEPFHLIVFC